METWVSGFACPLPEAQVERYMEDIRTYLGVKMTIQRNSNTSKRQGLSKYQSDLQLVQRDVPFMSIEVEFNLAEDQEQLRNQEAQLYK